MKKSKADKRESISSVAAYKLFKCSCDIERINMLHLPSMNCDVDDDDEDDDDNDDDDNDERFKQITKMMTTMNDDER